MSINDHRQKGQTIFQVQVKRCHKRSGSSRAYALTPKHAPSSFCQQLISLHYHLRREIPISPDTSTALLLPSGFYLLSPPAKTLPRAKGSSEQERSRELQNISGRKTPGLFVYSCFAVFCSEKQEMPSKSVAHICPLRRDPEGNKAPVDLTLRRKSGTSDLHTGSAHCCGGDEREQICLSSKF